MKATAPQDLLASVDWSGYAKASPPAVALLGDLEAWATGYAEEEISGTEFRLRLESVLPAAAGS